MKKVFIMAAAAVLAACAQAEYLYWMVSEDPASAEAVEFQYAKVAVSGNGAASGTYLADDNGNNEFLWSGFGESSPSGYSTLGQYVNLGSYWADGYSYAIELYNASDALVGVSSPATFAALGDFVYGDMKQSGITPWVVSAVTAVPEPSGSCLFLVGAALLALKRRRAVV